MRILKIHVHGSIRGKRSRLLQVIESVRKLGHSVVTNHYLLRKISDIKNETHEESLQFAEKLHSWIHQADIVICEATHPDLGIGFEAHYALTFPKPLIVLVHDSAQNYPFPINSFDAEYLQVVQYNEHTLERVLKDAIQYASDNLGTRFHVILPNNTINYITRLAIDQETSKAAVLRNIVEEHRERHSQKD